MKNTNTAYTQHYQWAAVRLTERGPRGEGWVIVSQPEVGGASICTVTPRADEEANATLIAALPQMIRALRAAANGDNTKAVAMIAALD